MLWSGKSMRPTRPFDPSATKTEFVAVPDGTAPFKKSPDLVE